MFLKVVLFCSQGLGRIYRQVKWKVYYLNKGNFMGLSNEISFVLIFLAVSYLWIKTLDWNLPLRYNMSVSVFDPSLLTNITLLWHSYLLRWEGWPWTIQHQCSWHMQAIAKIWVLVHSCTLKIYVFFVQNMTMPRHICYSNFGNNTKVRNYRYTFVCVYCFFMN